jgi:hypothetical protein
VQLKPHLQFESAFHYPDDDALSLKSAKRTVPLAVFVSGSKRTVPLLLLPVGSFFISGLKEYIDCH